VHIDQRQEQFSKAYVRAVAAVAGFRVQEGPQPDDDSVDLTISARGPLGTVRSPKLDVQMKSTRVHVDGDPIPYPLSMKNYEELRHTDYSSPRVLVLVAVPPELQDWIAHSEAELVLRRCGYWLSLSGQPPVLNTTTVTVRIPRSNRFSVEGLNGIMERIGRGEGP
jgi:hypothetical protein